MSIIVDDSTINIINTDIDMSSNIILNINGASASRE